MIDNLRKKIEAIQQASSKISANNHELLAAQRELEKRNTDLKKFNDITINRELKMVELKKRIEELETKVKELERH